MNEVTAAAEKRLLELQGVNKLFLTDEVETHALSNVHLSVKKGEWLAIVGPSGSGKTTLLALLGLLDTPSNGTYLLDGEPVSGLTPAQRAYVRNRHIGFIFQSFNLIGDLTVYENVELPLTYRGMPAAERKAKVEAALERVGMAHRARHMPAQLSGGQQQRVAVARAVAGDPLILLADEPTGNLDSKNGAASDGAAPGAAPRRRDPLHGHPRPRVREARHAHGQPLRRTDRRGRPVGLLRGPEMDRLLSDVKFALRGLMKSRGFTFAAVLALALGIGASTAIFSILDAVWVRPYQFAPGDRLQMLWESVPKQGLETNETAVMVLDDVRKRSHVFQELAGYSSERHQHLGRRPSGAADVGARPGRVLRGARGEGAARADLRRRGGSPDRRAGDGAQRQAVPAPLRRRSGGARPHRHPRRPAVHGDRGAAEGVLVPERVRPLHPAPAHRGGGAPAAGTSGCARSAGSRRG